MATVDDALAARALVEDELYAGREAFDAHEKQPHTQRFLAEREVLLTSTEVDFLTPLDAVIRPTPTSPRA